MKKYRNSLLLVPILASLSCGNIYSRPNNNGFVAGVCALGAAALGAVGIAAAMDWFCETDEQLIYRTENGYQRLYAQYNQTMNYFAQRAGVGSYMPNKPIQYIAEDVLYEFATSVWNSSTYQSTYRADVWSARNTLQSYTRDLNKRITNLANKYNSYEDQRRLSIMRNLASKIELLLADIILFADCLECHKTYFTLYDSVGHIRNRYLQQITILESGRYSVATEIKNYVLASNNSQYAFMHFVQHIESDICTLQSDIYALKYNYDAMQQYTYYVINQLTGIKNIVALDPRYQEELYQWEQARLERARIEAIEAQARLERDRNNILRQQNRILEERNRLERQKIHAQQIFIEVPVVETSVSINCHL